jgi:transcriptional regulator with XRE-family HTH domain
MDKVTLLDRAQLTALRKQRELTQKGLAAKAGLSYHLVAALETGARDNPTIETLYALTEALDVPGHELAPRLCRCPHQSDAA